MLYKIFANGGEIRVQVGAYSPECRPWGRINTLGNHLKACLKQIFRPKYAKKQYVKFWKKATKE